jgi:hypothetical protein
MIVKCSHCGAILSDIDFDSHTCDKPVRECRTIEVSEIIDGSYGNRKLLNGWGTDGVLYTFEVVPRKPLPIILPLHQTGVNMNPDSDEELTEPKKATP